jgi:hypothetical protein
MDIGTIILYREYVVLPTEGFQALLRNHSSSPPSLGAHHVGPLGLAFLDEVVDVSHALYIVTEIREQIRPFSFDRRCERVISWTFSIQMITNIPECVRRRTSSRRICARVSHLRNLQQQVEAHSNVPVLPPIPATTPSLSFTLFNHIVGFSVVFAEPFASVGVYITSIENVKEVLVFSAVLVKHLFQNFELVECVGHQRPIFVLCFEQQCGEEFVWIDNLQTSMFGSGTKPFFEAGDGEYLINKDADKGRVFVLSAHFYIKENAFTIIHFESPHFVHSQIITTEGK